MTRRVTLIAALDYPGEAEFAEDWIAANRARLSHVSAQKGCGCCVLIWDIEGPDAVIATLPPDLVSDPGRPRWRADGG
ncbi:hypothetical protein ACE7GA_13045 [Roseomonas sp. CCTCC AB2023176]|uniref:hypothetical protein n=1 Tax=Roseomonas sp. CCTCC AB2023176 TaxID=3342640 RepID=UPI0035DACE36